MTACVNGVDAGAFVDALLARDVTYFAGVPDTLLRQFCSALRTRLPAHRHLIACNEGAAVGTAVGHYLATGTLGMVYMQNSGLGNAMNPLLSLAARQVCGVPMLLLVGWRGEPEGAADEPQHQRQGAVTLALLQACGLRHALLEHEASRCWAQLDEAVQQAKYLGEPVALLVRRGLFSSSFGDGCVRAAGLAGGLAREQALEACIDALPSDAVTVTTTGMAARELFEIRARRGMDHALDFLAVGGMGHAAAIAFAIAQARPRRCVVCLDGDGAMLMHMGALSHCAQAANLLHVVINNGAHDSVGGQPTAAAALELGRFASAAGYAHVASVGEAAELRGVLGELLQRRGSSFIEVRCVKGSRADLGRPRIPPRINKERFMSAIGAAGVHQEAP